MTTDTVSRVVDVLATAPDSDRVTTKTDVVGVVLVDAPLPVKLRVITTFAASLTLEALDAIPDNTRVMFIALVLGVVLVLVAVPLKL